MTLRNNGVRLPGTLGVDIGEEGISRRRGNPAQEFLDSERRDGVSPTALLLLPLLLLLLLLPLLLPLLLLLQ